jgi:hypothetical protein
VEDGVAGCEIVVQAHQAERVGALREGADGSEVGDADGLGGTVAERAFVIAIGRGIEGEVWRGSGGWVGGDAGDIGPVAGDGVAAAVDDPCDEAVVVIRAQVETFCGGEA